MKDLKKSSCERIKWESDNNGDVPLYLNRNEKRFNEIHFFTLSNEKPKVMISFFGDITLKEH